LLYKQLLLIEFIPPAPLLVEDDVLDEQAKSSLPLQCRDHRSLVEIWFGSVGRYRVLSL
jgi:hypothetical protein